MEIKVTKFAHLDGLELKEATFRNHVFPEHFHDAYSLGILESGIEKVSFPGKDILVHANSVIIINPYEIHANSFFDSDSWKYRIIYIGADLMKFVQKQKGLPGNQTIWFPRYLIDDLYLYKLFLNFHASRNIDRTSALLTILDYLISNYATDKPEKEQNEATNEISDIIGFMQNHLYDKIILDQLAAKCHMGKYKFIRTFKMQAGLTPGSYLLLQRINKAKKLIASDLPITEIALETGFYDQSHFIHCFKKYIGVTPLHYKRGLISE